LTHATIQVFHSFFDKDKGFFTTYLSQGFYSRTSHITAFIFKGFFDKYKGFVTAYFS